MDKNTTAILLAFALYGLYVFLPLIPAILIYKLFPKDNISASGVFSNFKFNATGAFAGYVITVFLGLGMVDSIRMQIEKSANPTWTIKTKLEIYDQDENLIRDHFAPSDLQVKVSPELVTVRGDFAILKLPGHKANWPKTFLEFNIPSHGVEVVDLGEASKQAEIDEYNLTITLSDPVKIYQTRNLRSNFASQQNPFSGQLQHNPTLANTQLPPFLESTGLNSDAMQTPITVPN